MSIFAAPSIRRQVRIVLFALVCCTTACRAEDAVAPIPGATPAPIRFLLSFDDGPSGDHRNNSTEQVLDALAHNSVQPETKAIFFLQTRAARGGGTDIGKALMQREQQEGHLLEFHTATEHHSNHRFLSAEEFEQSLDDGIADLTAIKGVPPTLVRPPFWNYDETTLAGYEKHGMHVLLTDLNANDGKIWGINFSLTKHHNMYTQLDELRAEWQAGKLPVVDGCTPIVVTFHDVNTYTSNHIEVYMKILLQVAQELDMPTAEKPFYDNRADLEKAAQAKAVKQGEVRPRLPGLWNWLWQ